MKKIKRILICAVLITVCFLLETTVFQKLAFASIIPNLLIIVTSSFGFMRGQKEGMIIGFFCGLLKDILGGNLLGFYALIYMYIGYLNGFFKRIFFSGCGIFTCLVTRIHIFPLVAEIVVSASSSVTFTDTSGIEK